MSSTPMMLPRHVGQLRDVVRWRRIHSPQKRECMQGISTVLAGLSRQMTHVLLPSASSRNRSAVAAVLSATRSRVRTSPASARNRSTSDSSRCNQGDGTRGILSGEPRSCARPINAQR
jgi:hypothetical protein